jgi:hypothetical protein
MSDRVLKDERRLLWTRAERLFLAALLGATFLCYLPALGYEFVYDDRLLILKNPQILFWQSIPQFFREDFTSPAMPGAPAVYYRPVLLVWMMLNAKIWGMSPPGWHFTAIALHLVVIAEVYAVARRLLADRFASGVAASVFALHPVHVECVTWVMAEAEQLAASLFIGSLLAFFRARDCSCRHRAWLISSLALFALAVLIKENMLILPVLIAAIEWLYGAGPDGEARARRGWLRLGASLWRATPYGAVAIAYLGVRVAVLKGLGQTVTSMPLSTHLATLPFVLFTYLRLLLWPLGLSVCYDIPYTQHLTFQNFLLPLAAAFSFTALLVRWSFSSRSAAFAAVWLGLPILPLLDLPVFFRGEIVHDRYLYLPSVGFALLAGHAFGALRTRARERGRRALVPYAAAAGLAGLLAAGTCYDRRFWKDNWNLFQRAARIAPRNVIALNNLGTEFAERGRYEEALLMYRQVMAEDPTYGHSIYNAGYCLYKLGP